MKISITLAFTAAVAALATEYPALVVRLRTIHDQRQARYRALVEEHHPPVCEDVLQARDTWWGRLRTRFGFGAEMRLQG